MSIYYSPLRYPGGKNCIFQFVSNFFYENQLLGVNYAEPYSGGAGLALRLLFEGYVDKIFINDLDIYIYSFWKSIIEKPNEFCKWIEDVEVSVKNWKKYKKVLNMTGKFNYFELGKATFFLNRANVSGVIKGGIIGGFKQKGKYKIDARFNKVDLVSRIQKIAAVKNRISVSNYDGLHFIKMLNKRKEEIFIYLDPPYYQKGADLYMNYYSKTDHQRLAKHVNKLEKNWMVSYDNHDFILNLYAKNKIAVYKLSQSASNRVGDEMIIIPKKLDFSNSITYLKSASCIE